MKLLRGIVMCGGQSKRMGTDKGLISIDRTRWAGLMADKLKQQYLEVSLSVNVTQVEAYSSALPDFPFIVDSVDIGGPLNGIISAHLQHPDDDLLIIACDLINMQAKTINNLIGRYKSEPGFEFYVYQNENFAEPLCAVYTAVGLHHLIQNVGLDNLHEVKLQKVLNNGRTLRLFTTEINSFDNFNTKKH